jgi:hypothetical protein
MNCPVDGTPLAMTKRQGVVLDHCPNAAASGSTAANSTSSANDHAATQSPSRPSAPAK